jgi:hypothetical protein
MYRDAIYDGVGFFGNPQIGIQVGHSWKNSESWSIPYDKNDTVEIILESLQDHCDDKFSAQDQSITLNCQIGQTLTELTRGIKFQNLGVQQGCTVIITRGAVTRHRQMMCSNTFLQNLGIL